MFLFCRYVATTDLIFRWEREVIGTNSSSIIEEDDICFLPASIKIFFSLLGGNINSYIIRFFRDDLGLKEKK